MEAGMLAKKSPHAPQKQLAVHGCTYSWQLHLMAASTSLLCPVILYISECWAHVAGVPIKA